MLGLRCGVNGLQAKSDLANAAKTDTLKNNSQNFSTVANFRLPLPICSSFGHPGIDEGTLCRSLSALPGTIQRIVSTTSAFGDALSRCAALLGTIRNTVSSATQAAGDAVVWGWDAIELYNLLEAQGLLFLLDVYGGKAGTGALGVAQAFDNRVNNMGALHTQFSRKHRVGAMLPFDKLALWFADNDPMKEKCLEHYINGQGAEFRFTAEQVKLMPTYLDIFQITAYSPNMRFFIEEAKRGQTVKLKTSVAGQNDALGNFTIHLEGELKPATGTPTGPATNAYYRTKTAADPGVPLRFEGRMDWYDKWDFDSKIALKLSGKKTGRPAQADLVVAAVAALVDGVPFDVVTGAIPVVQYSGRFPDY